jgi:hypothetical protein
MTINHQAPKQDASASPKKVVPPRDKEFVFDNQITTGVTRNTLEFQKDGHQT